MHLGLAVAAFLLLLAGALFLFLAALLPPWPLAFFCYPSSNPLGTPRAKPFPSRPGGGLWPWV